MVPGLEADLLLLQAPHCCTQRGLRQSPGGPIEIEIPAGTTHGERDIFYIDDECSDGAEAIHMGWVLLDDLDDGRGALCEGRLGNPTLQYSISEPVERVRSGVDPVVVGHCAFDGGAVLGEELQRSTYGPSSEWGPWPVELVLAGDRMDGDRCRL